MRIEELVARSAAQRAALIASATPIVRAVEKPDRIVAFVRRYPAGIAVGAVALALLGPRRLLAAGTRLLSVYTLFRQLAR